MSFASFSKLAQRCSVQSGFTSIKFHWTKTFMEQTNVMIISYYPKQRFSSKIVTQVGCILTSFHNLGAKTHQNFVTCLLL
jgi:IS30 family transposase